MNASLLSKARVEQSLHLCKGQQNRLCSAVVANAMERHNTHSSMCLLLIGLVRHESDEYSYLYGILDLNGL